MECNKCGWVMPFDAEFDNAACITCDGVIKYSATEYLEHPALGLVSESRNAQVDLTSLITQGIREDKQVVVEAGTGVGKSFAYLLPALLSGRRAVVTTAKKTLQTQLIKKDLPYLQKQLGLVNPHGGPLFARAYGKGNYACWKLVNRKTNKSFFKGPLAKEFFQKTEHGVWEEAPAILTGLSPKLLKVISRGFGDLSAENCIGPTCEYYKDCHFVEDRKEMASAQIVVANHWLVGLDMMLHQQQDFSFLGDHSILIVDEAQKFEDGVRSAFTQEIKCSALQEIIHSIQTVNNWMTDVETFGGTLNAKLPGQKHLESAWNQMFNKLKGDSTVNLGPEGMGLMLAIDGVYTAINLEYVQKTFYVKSPKTGMNTWSALIRGLNPNITDGPAIPATETTDVAKRKLGPGAKELYETIQVGTRTLRNIQRALFLIQEKDPDHVVYLEDNSRYPAIKVAPIDISDFLRKNAKRVPTVVHTSATMAIGGSLNHYAHRAGIPLTQALQAQYGSAFDYNKQALLYVSRNTVVPSKSRDPTDTYVDKLTDEIFDLIKASNGNAFVLFTAKREMHAVYDRLMDRGCTLPLVVQDAAASEALREYKNTQNAVLLGLKSFWEGVDIPGTKLELVIVAKLPFPLRSDPIIQARCDKAGDKWFQQVYIPEMILDLRQGVGRLIRSKKDRGVVALLDARLEKKSYKNTVLRSLGFSQITANKAAVIQALSNLAAQRK